MDSSPQTNRQYNSSLSTSQFLSLQGYQHASLFDEVTYPWQVLPIISKYLAQYFTKIPQQNRLKGKTSGLVHYEGDVCIGQGTVIQHGVFIKGPAVIGRNCQLRKGAYIRGNVIVGDNCIMGNSTELKNCVLLDKVQACHFNYVGDSILGKYSHLSAGVITSNLKLDQKQVYVHTEGRSIATGLAKFGAILGDRCEIGCNVVLNPGSIVGRNSVIYPGVSFRGVLAANKICKLLQQQVIVDKH